MEKTKIVEVYDGEKTTLASINYDYANKELEIETDDGDIMATIDNSDKGLVVFGIFDNREKMEAAAEVLRESRLAKTVFATEVTKAGGNTNDK